FLFFFFFSSRRRHTRWPRDWSSDVCSSDLDLLGIALTLQDAGQRVEYWRVPRQDLPVLRGGFERVYRKGRKALKKARAQGTTERSEERRVGKEGRSGGGREQEEEKGESRKS